jgi:hypothetical protein
MTHRSDAIRLPGDVSRCEPGCLCTMKTKCARYQAALPKFGGSMTDFSLPSPAHVHGGTALCRGYINVATLHALPEKKPAPVVKPSVRGIG